MRMPEAALAGPGSNGKTEAAAGAGRCESTSEFLSRLDRRQVTVGVIGLGYTGLPLAVASARAGLPTTGYESNPRLAARLSRGISHIEDVPAAELQAVVTSGAL